MKITSVSEHEHEETNSPHCCNWQLVVIQETDYLHVHYSPTLIVRIQILDHIPRTA